MNESQRSPFFTDANLEIELGTARLTLALPRAGDADAIAAYHHRNRVHMAPWVPDRNEEFYTAAFWEKRVIEQRKLASDGREINFLLRKKEPTGPGQIIGTLALSQISRGPFQACYLGFGLDAEFVGQGHMQEALEAALQYAFADLKLHRIMANYLPQNWRSERILAKMGFKKEGYAVAYLHINGAWRDHVLTALITPCDAVEAHPGNPEASE